MRKTVLTGSLVLACGLMLAGCGGGSKSYKDGTYTGQSEVYTASDLGIEDEDDEDEAANGYGVVELTIKDNAITACTFTTYEEDGTLKDENYGMIDGEIKNRDYYNKAQKANQACEKYAQQLVESGDVDDVDVISGATINYHNFVDAVDDALSQAEE